MDTGCPVIIVSIAERFGQELNGSDKKRLEGRGSLVPGLSINNNGSSEVYMISQVRATLKHGDIEWETLLSCF